MTEGSHVWMWELSHKEGWAPTNCYFLIVVLKNTLESSLDSKEIKLVYLKGNQPWIFIGRTDAETKAPRLWPPGVKSLHIGKDSDAGKDWKQKEKWEAEDKMVREHHQLNGHEFEQSPGDSENHLSRLLIYINNLYSRTMWICSSTICLMKLCVSPSKVSFGSLQWGSYGRRLMWKLSLSKVKLSIRTR